MIILRKFLSLFLLCTIFVACSLLSSVSFAEKNIKNDIFTRFKKPLPELTLLSDQDFLKSTKPIKKKPYGLDVLEYTIRIPKGWAEREDKSSSNFILSDKLFLALNVFYGKPTPFGRSRIEVEALELEGSLTAEQWYLKYILEGGYTTEGFVTHSENKIEALMVLMGRDYTYYVRTLVILNGDKVVMLKYFVPVHHIKDEASMQEQVLSSFELVNDIERTPVSMASYRFLDIAELKYPGTWKVYSKPLRSVNRMDVTLLNLKTVVGNRGEVSSVSTEGKLEVNVIAASNDKTLLDEIADFKKQVEAGGMLIGEKISVADDLSYNENIDFGLTEVYESVDSSNNLTEYELLFTVMVAGNYYYIFTLLTPSRNERFAVWAENTQNYKAIIKSFRPMSGAFLERDY